METNDRIAQLESEIKVLKNEVQAVLLDLRDKYLEAENPFNAPHPQAAAQTIVIDRQGAAVEAQASVEPPAARAQKEKRDRAPEPTGVSDGDEAEAPPEVAGGEVTRAGQLEGDCLHARHQCTRDSGRQIGLVTIGGLANWADESVRKLGRQRTQSILDFSEMMGLLPPDMKHIMTKLISVEGDGDAEALSPRDYLGSLVRITTLLGRDNQTEEALLSMVMTTGRRNPAPDNNRGGRPLTR